MNAPFNTPDALAFGARSHRVGRSLLVHADCMEWLGKLPENSIDAIVTDPPYGVREYESLDLDKMRNGGAGIWRIPPSFDGCVRAPLPRFTALDPREREILRLYFIAFGKALLPALKPGAHVFIACNAFLSQLVFHSLMEAGLEFRTEVLRLVQTLRGGDRPKLGEKDYPDVCSLPRGGYEPWGLFRKPMPGKMTVRECLREYGTGGLRRRPDGNPFFDVIPSERTPRRERDLADHPSLKPQSLMRQLVHASLPLGTGMVVDPFAGSASTVAAAEAIGYRAVGIERDLQYFEMAAQSAPKLAALKIAGGTSAVSRAEQIGLALD